MLNGRKVIVVMPAYNAARTLERTYHDLPLDIIDEASSINFARSVRYGFGVLATSIQFRLQRMGLGSFRIFESKGGRLPSETLEDADLLKTSDLQ